MRRLGVRSPLAMCGRIAIGCCFYLVAAFALAEVGAPASLPATDGRAVDPVAPPLLSEAQAASGRVPRLPIAPLGRLPAEFERQSAILLGCAQLADEMPDLFAHLTLQMRGRVEIFALVNGEEGRRRARKVLADRHVRAPHVHYVNLRHNSMWTRDFGPLTVRQIDGRPVLIDTWYNSPERLDDDAVPALLSEMMAAPLVDASLFLDGGNLLSNGQGLLLATYDLAEQNLGPDNGPEQIRANLGQLFGATDVVFLEPLAGEPTGHVDMFATFTSPQTVVVASIDPALDAENARILDQNAARLASVRVAGRRLRVVRLPMPAADDNIWRSYTNVLYANGLLLAPIYPDKDPDGSRAALAAYRRVMPRWQVEPVDAEALAELGGALHCVTMNMTTIDRHPVWLDDEKPEQPLSRWAKEQDERFRRRIFGTENGIEATLPQ